MKTDEIRDKYLEFYASKGHTVCPSDVLVPNDPTVLFTPAGMNPFKDHFLGNVELEFTRATSCQKCLRTGDIENVGRTAYHHTFFEMLGNFSFGDYFKRDAIHWAWEFLTEKKWLGIDANRLSVTVYLDDDDAANIWRDDIGLPLKQINRLGEHDNFWPAGAPTDGPDGVCGPCSEIFFHPDDGGECEIWNLVFTQFNREGNPPDNLAPLPSKNIDTGMGLERIAAVLQGAETNFHIDSLLPVVHAAADVCGVKYVSDTEDGRRLRRITDHVRACAFAIHENVLPGAEKANYTVRRLLRRAVFQGRQMGINDPFLYKIVPAVVDAMQHPYPELAQSADSVASAMKFEEESFFKVIQRGMRHVDRFIETTRQSGSQELDAKQVFDFNQTYGVPPELTTSVAAEFGMEMDWEKYQQHVDRHALDSGQGGKGVMGNAGPIDELKQEIKTTPFVGYDCVQSSATVKGCGTTDNRLESIGVAADSPQQFLVLDQTPFYVKSGGQESDFGTIVGPHGTFAVKELKKTGGLVVHFGAVTSGSISVGEQVDAVVDAQRRQGLCRAHSATHILHHALQSNLGSHAQQRGSKVEIDDLRFDFANDGAIPANLLSQIESQTLGRIEEASAISAATIPLEQAKTEGAMMLFGEKYPDPVRMVSIGSFSKELCGGTHLENTAQIEAFEIVSEESASAGVRRIVAYTGGKAKEYQSQIKTAADQMADQLEVDIVDLPAAVAAVMKHVKALKKQISTGAAAAAPEPISAGSAKGTPLDYFAVRDAVKLSAAQLNSTVKDVASRVAALVQDREKLIAQAEQAKSVATVSADQLIESAEQIGDAILVSQQIDGANADLLKRLVDQIRKKASPAAILLAAKTAEDKVLLVAGVSKELVASGVKAGDVVKAIAPVVGGGGGGKPDLAQAGGKNPEKITEALEKGILLLREQLAA